MRSQKRRSAPPRAGAMIESLRGLGYNTATALADIVDNSISADASEVDIRFEWSKGSPWIRVLDNGHGMTEYELEVAMRFGERNPVDKRDETDLGRFGLGLKTASFSQARRLTVASKRKSQKAECFRWDLDLLTIPGDDGWHLYEGPDPSSVEKINDIDQIACGTLVLWENLDRIVTTGFEVQDFLDMVDLVEQHLAMTFHRLLDDGDHLRLSINGKAIKGWDPFLTGNPSKPWAPSEIQLSAPYRIIAQCHVLPHSDYLSKTETEKAAGPAGWVLQEGFYIYRNRRLIVAGGWLGLGLGRTWVPDEPHRLARIRLDIPNSADADWKIDIRKSRASPPAALRSMLTKLAAETRERARAVFAFRGQYHPRNKTEKNVEVWVAEKSVNGTRYRISRKHDIVRNLLEKVGPLAKDIEGVLRLLETTVPVQRIWLDTATDRETPRNGLGNERVDELRYMVKELFDTFVNEYDLTPEAARSRLSRTAPFNMYPELVASIGIEKSTHE